MQPEPIASGRPRLRISRLSHCRINAIDRHYLLVVPEEDAPVVPEVVELLEVPAEPPDVAPLDEGEPRVDDDVPDEPIPDDEPVVEPPSEPVVPEAAPPVVPVVPEPLEVVAESWEEDALLVGATEPVADPLADPIPDVEPDAEPLALGPEPAQAARVRAQAKARMDLVIHSPC